MGAVKIWSLRLRYRMHGFYACLSLFLFSCLLEKVPLVVAVYLSTSVFGCRSILYRQNASRALRWRWRCRRQRWPRRHSRLTCVCDDRTAGEAPLMRRRRSWSTVGGATASVADAAADAVSRTLLKCVLLVTRCVLSSLQVKQLATYLQDVRTISSYYLILCGLIIMRTANYRLQPRTTQFVDAEELHTVSIECVDHALFVLNSKSQR